MNESTKSFLTFQIYYLLRKCQNSLTNVLFFLGKGHYGNGFAHMPDADPVPAVFPLWWDTVHICRPYGEPVFTIIALFFFTTVLLTTGAAGEAVSVIQVPHGLAGLAGSVDTLPTFDTDSCRTHVIGESMLCILSKILCMQKQNKIILHPVWKENLLGII